MLLTLVNNRQSKVRVEMQGLVVPKASRFNAKFAKWTKIRPSSQGTTPDQMQIPADGFAVLNTYVQEDPDAIAIFYLNILGKSNGLAESVHPWVSWYSTFLKSSRTNLETKGP